MLLPIALHACQFMVCMDYESEIKIYYYYYYINRMIYLQPIRHQNTPRHLSEVFKSFMDSIDTRFSRHFPD